MTRRRVRPVEDEVAGDGHVRPGARRGSALRTAVEREGVAVDVGQDRDAASSEHPFARDDEAERRLAGDLAVDAGDAPAAAEAAAELLHRDLEAEGVARA